LANPTDNLYNTYWRRWVVELFSDKSRKRIAYFKLNPLDIYNAKFNDQIFILDSYWRILKMEADVNSEGLTKVELIKILLPQPICNLSPAGLVNGKIVFEDAEGEPAAATEECCSAYGYTWTGASCVQVQTEPPAQNLSFPDIIGGVELKKIAAGVSVGFEVLTYQGTLTKNELLNQGNKMEIPYGTSMTFNAELLVSEFDKVLGVEKVEKQTWQGIVKAQYDDASPDVEITIQRVSRMGDGSNDINLILDHDGNRLTWEVDDSSNEIDFANVALRIDYVLARN
jgi:hypothetical protein